MNQIIEYIILLSIALPLISYTTTLIYRVPRNVPICGIDNFGNKPYCDHCNHPLRFWEYYTILSAITTRFKCNYCGVKITPIYFISEMFLLFVILFAFHRIGFTEQYILTIAFTILNTIAITSNIQNFKIREDLLIGLFAVAAIYQTLIDNSILEWVYKNALMILILLFSWKLVHMNKKISLFNKEIGSIFLIISIFVDPKFWVIFFITYLFTRKTKYSPSFLLGFASICLITKS